jgi:hypothetical protein
MREAKRALCRARKGRREQKQSAGRQKRRSAAHAREYTRMRNDMHPCAEHLWRDRSEGVFAGTHPV